MIPWLFHLQIRTLSDCYCRLLFPPTNCCGCHCGWHDDKTEDHGHPSVTRKFADYSFVWWWEFRGRNSLLFPCTTEAILKIPRGRHIRVLSDSQDGASAHANPKASICSTHAARGVAIPLRALSTKNFTSRLKSESTWGQSWKASNRRPREKPRKVHRFSIAQRNSACVGRRASRSNFTRRSNTANLGGVSFYAANKLFSTTNHIARYLQSPCQKNINQIP